MFGILAIFSTLALISAQTKEEDEIKNLPGVDFKLNFRHYSGYLQVNSTRFLHYWHVTSQNDPEHAPLVFWFNGGPTCSSLFGLLGENGPYLAKKGGECLRQNPDAWNKNANVVYFESPAGVGYSYATEPYVADDDQTARENRNGIVAFLRRFPEYKDRRVFIFGKSYAGIYLPTLGVEILNKQDQFRINLEGIGIGNGCVDFNIHDEGLAKMAFYRGAVDMDEWEDFGRHCCHGCAETCNLTNLQGDCYKKMINFSNMLPNEYDIYIGCQHEGYMKILQNTRISFDEARKTHARYITENCIDDSDYANYLIRKDVRQALHIPEFWPDWEEYSGNGNLTSYNETYRSSNVSMHDFIKKIVASKVRVLLFYGDSDTRCNPIMGEIFARNLGLKKLKAKEQWDLPSKPSGNLAGWKTTYDGLIYATVADVGHMVAEWAPKRAHYMMDKFVKNEF